MRDVVEEPPPALLRGLEGGRHRVEGGSELRELVGAHDGNALAVVPLRDALRARREPRDRTHDPARQEQADRGRGQRRPSDREHESEEDGVAERHVEMALHVGRNDAERVADVAVEEPGGDREGDERERDAARDDHEHLRREELGCEAAPDHEPRPMR